MKILLPSLDESGINEIFHWKDQTVIIKIFLFMALKNAARSWTTEKIEVLSVKNLTFMMTTVW